MSKLIKCPACKSIASDAAENCPGCGHPFKERASVASGVFWGLFAFFILLPIAITVFFVFMGGALVGVAGLLPDPKAAPAQTSLKDSADMARAQREADERIAARRELEAERAAQAETPEAIAERKKAEADHQEALRAEGEQRAAQLAAEKELKERPARERAAKLIAYQLAQASNGLPSFQVEIAKRYLKGDGLPKDDALATHWLKAACTNQDSTASNLLGGIPKG